MRYADRVKELGGGKKTQESSANNAKSIKDEQKLVEKEAKQQSMEEEEEEDRPVRRRQRGRVSLTPRKLLSKSKPPMSSNRRNIKLKLKFKLIFCFFG